MENAFYTCYETAHKLNELKNFGFLSVTEPEKKEEKKEDNVLTKELPISTCGLFDTKEADQFCENITVKKGGEGKIFIVSTEPESHFDFLNGLVENESEIVNSNNISSCKAEFANKTKIVFYGFLIDQYTLEAVEKLAEDISAMVFLVNDKMNEASDYSSYIIRRLTGMYDIPWIGSVVNTALTDSQKIKNKYGIPPNIPFFISDPKDKDHIKNLLLNLKKYEPAEDEEEEELTDQDKGA
jgi:hypothetical protein